jgi:hypothetical protein
MQIKCIFNQGALPAQRHRYDCARGNPARPAPGTFDVDKDGFPRSERSQIQTIGRAARNLDGVAILYADQITDSMKRDRRDRARPRQAVDGRPRQEPRVRKGGAGVRPVARAHAAGVRGARADNVVSILGKQDAATASVAAALS